MNYRAAAVVDDAPRVIEVGCAKPVALCAATLLSIQRLLQ